MYVAIVVSPMMNASNNNGGLTPSKAFNGRRYTEQNNSVITGIKMRE